MTAKRPRRVTIPEPLRKFLREVYAQIQAGAEATRIESDDLLQDHRVYGGLIDPQFGVFGFTYFPGPPDDDEPTWDLSVTRDEILRIATGDTEYLDLWKCDNQACLYLYESEDAYCQWCAHQEFRRSRA